MTHFESFKNKIENEGYCIVKVRYDTGESIYELIKHHSDTHRSCAGEMSRKAAQILAKATNTEIQVNKQVSVACGYKPQVLTGLEVGIYKEGSSSTNYFM